MSIVFSSLFYLLFVVAIVVVTTTNISKPLSLTVSESFKKDIITKEEYQIMVSFLQEKKQNKTTTTTTTTMKIGLSSFIYVGLILTHCFVFFSSSFSSHISLL